MPCRHLQIRPPCLHERGRAIRPRPKTASRMPWMGPAPAAGSPERRRRRLPALGGCRNRQCRRSWKQERRTPEHVRSALFRCQESRQLRQLCHLLPLPHPYRHQPERHLSHGCRAYRLGCHGLHILGRKRQCLTLPAAAQGLPCVHRRRAVQALQPEQQPALSLKPWISVLHSQGYAGNLG